MNNNFSRKFWGGTAAHRISRGLLVAFAVLAISGVACAQQWEGDQLKKDDITFSALANVTPPVALTPPAGNSEYLVGHGVGTQGYVCLPTSTGVSWTVNNARPEATLFTHIFGEAVQIVTHFLSPVVNPNDIGPNPPRFGDVTWQSSLDSSRVWAQKKNFITAGTEASCPNGGAIDCLLLQVIGANAGPAGGRSLTKASPPLIVNTNAL